MTIRTSIRARISRIGNSQGIRIPKVMLEQIDLNTDMLRDGQEGPEVELRVEEGELRLRPVREERAWEAQLLPKLERYSKTNPNVLSLLAKLLTDRAPEVVETELTEMVGKRAMQESLLSEAQDGHSWVDEEKRARLANYLRQQHPLKKQELDNAKKYGLEMLERDDTVWWFLMRSQNLPHHDHWQKHSEARGGSRHPDISYESIRDLMHSNEIGLSDRLVERLRTAFTQPGIDLKKTAAAVTAWYSKIETEGGIKAINQRFIEVQSLADIKEFVSGFVQVDVKSTSKILADMYHPALRHEIVDPSKLVSLGSREVSLEDRENSQDEEMQFCRQVVDEAGMDVWEVNWLMLHDRQMS